MRFVVLTEAPRRFYSKQQQLDHSRIWDVGHAWQGTTRIEAELFVPWNSYAYRFISSHASPFSSHCTLDYNVLECHPGPVVSQAAFAFPWM